MSSISDIWKSSPTTLEGKSLAQILSFAGDGKLKDGNSTSREFRDLLFQIPSKWLLRFIDSCLTDKFDDGGYALQDVINQVGVRLGFTVTPGIYRGKQDKIGYDGIWKSSDGHCLIIEVKTTDAYRVNLDVIANYRTKLISDKKITTDKSSILLVVGRQDTGDLEAQIRGSIHAWDIRLISADSLLKLLSLKETLNDAKTILQINELLKPREYTRIDKMIDVIFLTSKDLQLESPDDQEVNVPEVQRPSKEKGAYVNFHEKCLFLIQRKLEIVFIKESRVSFTDRERKVGLVCSVSKAHRKGNNIKYWFAFHPHQQEYLQQYQKSYVAFGCGSSDNTFLIPFNQFRSWIKHFWTTEKEDRMYYHVVIHQRDGKFLLQQPKMDSEILIDIDKYRV